MMVVASTIKCYLIYHICLLKCALHSFTMLLFADLQKNDIKKSFLILQLYHHVDILVEFECLSQASFLCQPLSLSSLEFSWFALCACNRNTVLPHTWDVLVLKVFAPQYILEEPIYSTRNGKLLWYEIVITIHMYQQIGTTPTLFVNTTKSFTIRIHYLQNKHCCFLLCSHTTYCIHKDLQPWQM